MKKSLIPDFFVLNCKLYELVSAKLIIMQKFGILHKSLQNIQANFSDVKL